MSREILSTLGITAVVEVVIGFIASFCFEHLGEMPGIIVTLSLHILQMIVVWMLCFRGVRGNATLLTHAVFLAAAAAVVMYFSRTLSLSEKMHMTVGEAVTTIILSILTILYLLVSVLLAWFRTR